MLPKSKVVGPEDDLAACQKSVDELDRTDNDKLTFEDLRLMRGGDELPKLPTKTHAYFYKRIQTSADLAITHAQTTRA